MMPTLGMRRTLSLGGLVTMTYEWMPGAGLAIAGSLFTWWKGSAVAEAVMEEKTKGLGSELASLKESIARRDEQIEKWEDGVMVQVRGTADALAQVTTALKVLAAEQSGINKMTVMSFEGVLKKLEGLDQRSIEHAVVIERLKVQRAGGE